MLQSCLNSQKKQIHLAGKSVFGWNQSVFKRVCFPFLLKKMSAVMCGSPHPSFIPMPMFVYLFVSACWEKAIIRFKKKHKVSQPAEIQLCSSLCADPFPPHPSLRCWGYSRTWCGSFPVSLCSTDGPGLVVSPPVDLLLVFVMCSCTSAPISVVMQIWTVD